MERWREQRGRARDLGTEMPQVHSHCSSVLLADVVPSPPHTICWADSPLMAAGQWDPALTRPGWSGGVRGERRGAFFPPLAPRMKCPLPDFLAPTRGTETCWALAG